VRGFALLGWRLWPTTRMPTCMHVSAKLRPSTVYKEKYINIELISIICDLYNNIMSTLRRSVVHGHSGLFPRSIVLEDINKKLAKKL
jgi:hypothetical protein